MWRTDSLADAVHGTLAAREAALREEQAVRGLDGLDELRLHPVIAEAFAAQPRPDGEPGCCGVLREQPYPHEWKKKRRLKVIERVDTRTGEVVEEVLPDHRDRLRCDLVLTPEPDQAIGDEWVEERRATKRKKKASGTLFESMAMLETPVRPAGLPPTEAFWLEVKVVAQFTYSCGVPGPNRTYASELLRGPVSDLTKLACDDGIAHAAALLVLFTIDEATARHDLTQLVHRCLDKDLPVSSPEIRGLPILDRVGNGWCAVCALGLRK